MPPKRPAAPFQATCDTPSKTAAAQACAVCHIAHAVQVFVRTDTNDTITLYVASGSS
jgi:cytochrome c553